MIPLLFLLLAVGSTHANVNVRHKRYLVYPDGGPARTQFIIGLGIPVDLKEASVTVGTVIKFQYDLPTNSTEYTSRIYGFADTVSRNINGDAKNNANDDKNINAQSGEENTAFEDVSTTENIGNLSEESKDVNNLVDITFDDKKKKRSIFYTEGQEISNTLAQTTELSLDEAIRRQEEIDKLNLEEEQEAQRMNRWDFYKILEQMVEKYGYTGRPCLLRIICEAAQVPFTHESGLLAEIGHILFTPSSTSDPLSHHTDNEYHAAERLGRETGACERIFNECEGSVLETFTQIGEDTLHKFGFM